MSVRRVVASDFDAAGEKVLVNEQNAAADARCRSLGSEIVCLGHGDREHRFDPQARQPFAERPGNVGIGERMIARASSVSILVPGTNALRSISSVNQKVLPLPRMLSTPISPPNVSTSSLTMESPSPVPP